jgi:hypothetical protein
MTTWKKNVLLRLCLRHPHNAAMRSPTHGLTFVEYYLLDVVGVLLGCLLFVLALLLLLARCLCRACRRTKQKEE